MRRYTTPNLKITLKNKDGTIMTDVPFLYVIFTIKGQNGIIEKEIKYEDVVDGVFEVKLTQEETAQFNVNEQLEAECNIIFVDGRSASSIKNIQVKKNLHNEVVLL